MDPNLSLFREFARYGVSISKMPLRRNPGEWTELKNGQNGWNKSNGGVEKRGGMTPLNADEALLGPILMMSLVPLSSLFDNGGGVSGDVWIALSGGLSDTWASLVGGTWTESDPGQDGAGPPFSGPAQVCAQNINGTLYFASNGASLSDPVSLWALNGGTATELVGTADWPTISGNQPNSIGGIDQLLGILYVHLLYPTGGSIESVLVTVDPSDGTVTQVGPAVLNNSAERGGLVVADGSAFFIYRPAGTGAVMELDLSSPSSWTTNSLPTTPSVGGYRPWNIYRVDNDVYVCAEPRTASNSPIIWKRAAGGSFATQQVLTGMSFPDECGPFFEQGGFLFCVFYDLVQNLVVYKLDGTWAEDENLTSVDGSVFGPAGMGVEDANGDLYIVADLFGAIVMKRTAAGVWSTATTLSAAGPIAGRAD